MPATRRHCSTRLPMLLPAPHTHARLRPQPEAEKFFTSLDAGLVHVAADVAGAIAAVKQLLA